MFGLELMLKSCNKSLMKKIGVVITLITLLGSSDQTFSQLKLHKQHGVEIMGTPKSFLAKNDFEYAIVVQSSSERDFRIKTFTCLAKQQGIWYLFKILGPYTPSSPVPELQVRPVIMQKKLAASEADSLIKLIRPDEGMKYSQEQLNALPKTCVAEFRGRKGTSGGFSDAATYHLAVGAGGNITSLYFYGASNYLRRCLPLNPEFGILKGMVNTFQTLDSLASTLNK